MSSFNTFLNDKGETAESIEEPKPDKGQRRFVCPDCGEEEQFIMYLTQHWRGYITIEGYNEYTHEFDPSEWDLDEYIELDVSSYEYVDFTDWEVAPYADYEIDETTEQEWTIECQNCSSQWSPYDIERIFNIEISVY